ncbi:single-strand DNA-binding protein [Pseudonocardia sediminis]|uniref:Single-stranded DNA-binding protein n=1 Tax=Pseudonocardia sediminis TaxID=1397368 RepID=A0A4Q7V256_PSEST|nr:single-stranded DNA-binding protein [Pseudonocardia sediminis]RZT87548.1 single-strand DNA-binding protein [Pseudonocardia sediminis]
MSLPSMSGTGNLVEDPTVRFTAAGKAVCEFRIAFNSRKFNKSSQEWEDGASCYLKATAWDQLAENISESLRKGATVNVVGRLKTDEWDDKNGGGKRSATVLELDSCGPDLGRATAAVNKVSRSTSGGGFGTPRPTGPVVGADDDPWGTPPAGKAGQDDEPPF